MYAPDISAFFNTVLLFMCAGVDSVFIHTHLTNKTTKIYVEIKKKQETAAEKEILNENHNKKGR